MIELSGLLQKGLNEKMGNPKTIFEKLEEHHVYLVLTIILLVVMAITGLVLLKNYLGWTTGTAVSGTAGYVTTINIKVSQVTAYWQGFYGLVSMERGYTEQQSQSASPGSVDLLNLFFDCILPTETTHELYASTNSSLDLSNAVAASTAMVDAFLNISPSSTDS